MKRDASTGRQLSFQILCLVPGPRWAVGLLLACPVAARTEENNQEPSSSRENSTERQGFLPQASSGTSQGLRKRFCHDTFQPQGLCMLLACLCLFFLVNLTEFRWGTLQTEQARDVLTKLERKVKLFLSLAKEPFSKTPPNTDKMASFLSPFWATMTSSVMHFHLSSPLYPDLHCLCFFFCIYFKTVLIF